MNHKHSAANTPERGSPVNVAGDQQHDGRCHHRHKSDEERGRHP